MQENARSNDTQVYLLRPLEHHRLSVEPVALSWLLGPVDTLKRLLVFGGENEPKLVGYGGQVRLRFLASGRLVIIQYAGVCIEIRAMLMKSFQELDELSTAVTFLHQSRNGSITKSTPVNTRRVGSFTPTSDPVVQRNTESCKVEYHGDPGSWSRRL